MGNDLLPGRPCLAVNVKGRVELDVTTQRNRGGIGFHAVGVCGRAGNVAGSSVRGAEEESVIYVTLRDLFRADDAAEGGKPRRNSAIAVISWGASSAPAIRGGDIPAAR